MVSPIGVDMCWCPAFAATEKGKVPAQQRIAERYRLLRTGTVDRNRSVPFRFELPCPLEYALCFWSACCGGS